MAANNFEVWDQPGTNMQSDSTYASDPQRTNGAAVNGLFPSPLANKLFYQLSMMIAALAAMMQSKGYDMLDSNFANLQASLANLITHNDVSAGNNSNGYWVQDATGRIHQWGSLVCFGGDAVVTFPTPYTNGSTVIPQVSCYHPSGNTGYFTIVSGSVSQYGFTVHQNNQNNMTLYWSCDGY